MDDAFILQTIGRLYLEFTRLQNLLQQLPQKDAEIAELRRLLQQVENESKREK